MLSSVLNPDLDKLMPSSLSLLPTLCTTIDWISICSVIIIVWVGDLLMDGIIDSYNWLEVGSRKSEELLTSDFRLLTPDSRLLTSDSRLPTSDFRLPTPDSRLPTSDSRLPTSYLSFMDSMISSMRPSRPASAFLKSAIVFKSALTLK